MLLGSRPFLKLSTYSNTVLDLDSREFPVGGVTAQTPNHSALGMLDFVVVVQPDTLKHYTNTLC